MKTIYKYAIPITDTQTIDLPRKARILSVANQRGLLCLYAILDNTERTEQRVITIAGTGNPLGFDEEEGSKRFIGTVVIEPLVWHVFEEMM